MDAPMVDLLENAYLLLWACVNATKINNLSMWFESWCGCHQFVTRLDRSCQKYDGIIFSNFECYLI